MLLAKLTFFQSGIKLNVQKFSSEIRTGFGEKLLFETLSLEIIETLFFRKKRFNEAQSFEIKVHCAFSSNTITDVFENLNFA